MTALPCAFKATALGAIDKLYREFSEQSAAGSEGPPDQGEEQGILSVRSIIAALPCDCTPPGRVDADGRRFTCSGSLDHVRDRIAGYLTGRGTKPDTAREMSIELADRLFDQEVGTAATTGPATSCTHPYLERPEPEWRCTRCGERLGRGTLAEAVERMRTRGEEATP